MEPQSNYPYENIDQEIDDGYHDKAVYFGVPLKDISKQAYDGIKTDAVNDYTVDELFPGDISICKPEYCR